MARKLILLTLAIIIFNATNGCAVRMYNGDDANMENPYWRVQKAKAVEFEYAQHFKKQLLETLIPLFGEDNVKVNVYIQLDFDRSSQEDFWVPDGKQVKHEKMSEEKVEHRDTTTQNGESANNSETRESKKIKYKVSHTETEMDIHPGRIQQINVAVLLDRQAAIRVGDEEALKEQISMLVVGSTPFREERGDTIVVQIADFRK